MHVGAYDDEPETVVRMHKFMEKEGYAPDITDKRMHHEIYLSDVRRVAPEKRSRWKSDGSVLMTAEWTSAGYMKKVGNMHIKA